ncbi:glycosyltransferase family 2 protein [Nanoarchaeota archaeon]
MKNPLVSVVLPAHNEEKYIGVCIESLLKQSYNPIEIFIVNDGSTDNTAEVVKKYPVTLLSQKKSGPGAAWNLGMKHAKGKVLMFWASDHIYGENYIKDLIKPILEGDCVRTLHLKEKIANKNKLWGRAWGERDYTSMKDKGVNTASLTLREVYEKSGGFDPTKGYADDQSIYHKMGIKAKLIDTDVQHFNPESLKETFAQTVWIATSHKHPLLIVLGLPLFPAYAVYKSIKHLRKDPYIHFFWFLPFFYSVKYLGFFTGALRKMIFGKVTRI